MFNLASIPNDVILPLQLRNHEKRVVGKPAIRTIWIFYIFNSFTFQFFFFSIRRRWLKIFTQMYVDDWRVILYALKIIILWVSNLPSLWIHSRIHRRFRVHWACRTKPAQDQTASAQASASAIYLDFASCCRCSNVGSLPWAYINSVHINIV